MKWTLGMNWEALFSIASWSLQGEIVKDSDIVYLYCDNFVDLLRKNLRFQSHRFVLMK
jgi:hypothetical protein